MCWEHSVDVAFLAAVEFTLPDSLLHILCHKMSTRPQEWHLLPHHTFNWESVMGCLLHDVRYDWVLIVAEVLSTRSHPKPGAERSAVHLFSSHIIIHLAEIKVLGAFCRCGASGCSRIHTPWQHVAACCICFV